MVMELTINQVISDGSSITKTVVINVATLTVKVFSDGDQIAHGSRSSNVGEKLCTLLLEAQLSEGLQLLVRDVGLGLEVGEVGRV